MAKLLWEWKPRFAVALVARGLSIVTSQTNCDVTSYPVVMRRYAIADGNEQPYKTSKTQVSHRGRIEIDHLYGLRSRDWYCNPAQHSLCRPARPQAVAQRSAQLVLCRIAASITPAQTVSWLIPITMDICSYFRFVDDDDKCKLSQSSHGKCVTWKHTALYIV